jgi:murein L,D-transpeptidase YcbB/YkuD
MIVRESCMAWQGRSAIVGSLVMSIVTMAGMSAAGATPAGPPGLTGPAPLATAAAPLPEAVPPPPPAPATPLALAVESRLAGPLRDVVAATGIRLSDADLAAARAFYVARGYASLWVDDAGLTARGRAVAAELARADEWGLTAADVAVAGLDRLDGSRAALSRAEVALTAAVLVYARQARGGRIADPEGMLSGFIDRKPRLLEPGVVLAAVADTPAVDAYLRGLHPRHRQFELLRQAYLTARKADVARAGATIPMGPRVIAGEAHPHVVLLRRRLGVALPAATADGTPPADDVLDAPLVAALKAFQADVGLKADGILGDKTRRQLNASAAPTADRLLPNMEQWRWMPDVLGETRVEVNLPEFEVRFVRDGRTVHTERVIIGEIATATPIFSDEMETVVFQPKWGVPDSIKIGELLPRLQMGGGLGSGLRMMRNGRHVDPRRVDWSRADIRTYQVYQPSGDNNALGVVKFLFPNKHAVYLHDTPTKGLFGARMRTFSHGCVRVRNPVRLAELLLDTDKGWGAGTIRDLVESGPEDNSIRLSSKISVHLTHFTAIAEEGGSVRYAPDVYGHEKRITLALDGRFDRIVKLDPKPAVAKPVAVAAARQPRQRGFDAPVGLGYATAPTWFGAPPPAPVARAPRGSAGTRYRAPTANDAIMRAFGRDWD